MNDRWMYALGMAKVNALTKDLPYEELEDSGRWNDFRKICPKEANDPKALRERLKSLGLVYKIVRERDIVYKSPKSSVSEVTAPEIMRKEDRKAAQKQMLEEQDEEASQERILEKVDGESFKKQKSRKGIKEASQKHSSQEEDAANEMAEFMNHGNTPAKEARESSIFDSPSEAGSLSRAQIKTLALTTKSNKKRKRWTREEEEALYEGVHRHGVGHWAKILKDYTVLRDRTNVNLKDKWRNICERET